MGMVNSILSMQQARIGQQAAMKAASIILKNDQTQGAQIAQMLQQATNTQAKAIAQSQAQFQAQAQAQPLQPGGIDVLA
jgi:recombinational DNA repair protein RecR